MTLSSRFSLTLKAKTLKQTKPDAEDLSESSKTTKDDAKGKAGGAPTADELQKQVAFLELTDWKIRANMGLERGLDLIYRN